MFGILVLSTKTDNKTYPYKIENAFQTEDGEKYLKVIINDKEWFSRHFV